VADHFIANVGKPMAECANEKKSFSKSVNSWCSFKVKRRGLFCETTRQQKTW